MEESQVETQQAETEKITEIHAEAEHPLFEDFSYLYKASDVIITGGMIKRNSRGMRS